MPSHGGSYLTGQLRAVRVKAGGIKAVPRVPSACWTVILGMKYVAPETLVSTNDFLCPGAESQNSLLQDRCGTILFQNRGNGYCFFGGTKGGYTRHI